MSTISITITRELSGYTKKSGEEYVADARQLNALGFHPYDCLAARLALNRFAVVRLGPLLTIKRPPLLRMVFQLAAEGLISPDFFVELRRAVNIANCAAHDGNEKWRSLYVGHFDRWKVYPNGDRERFTGKDNSPQKDREDVFYLRPSIERGRLDVARQVFEWYATEAISPAQIARRLRDLQVDPIYGKEWDKERVSVMLRNPAYVGRPTWNKRGGSRFMEFVRGQIREIPQGKIKSGRRREVIDFIGLEKPQFDSIVGLATWEAVQSKIQRASGQSKNGRKKTAQTSELWLKPFLICGHCMKPMRATRGIEKQRTWPSYFCGTYGTYGSENPTGCHCHRVKHDTIAKIVDGYFPDVAAKIRHLLSAARSGDSKLLNVLRDALGSASLMLMETLDELLEFMETNATPEEWKHFLKGDESERLVLYERVFERAKPQIERQIVSKEAELDRMLDDFRGLALALRNRANVKMEALEMEIKSLQTRLKEGYWTQAKHFVKELAVRSKAAERAVDARRNGEGGRRMTAIASEVVDRIVCRFTHTETKPKKRGLATPKRQNNGKSTLAGVEIHAVNGDVFTCFTDGNKVEQD
jgi:hypothetical protein